MTTPAQVWLERPHQAALDALIDVVLDPVTAGEIVKALAGKGYVVAPAERVAQAVQVDGDTILALRTTDLPNDDHEAVQAVARHLGERGAALVLLLGPDDSIEGLDETEMERVGWVPARRATGADRVRGEAIADRDRLALVLDFIRHRNPSLVDEALSKVGT